MYHKKPKWGQNFLIDENIQKEIVNFFNPTGDFGEIGPGAGAITQHLVKQGKPFVVFEIDPKWVDYHKMNPSIEVIEGDFLKWDFSLNGKQVSNFSLIGNLPYESGTKILLDLTEKTQQIDLFVFMLQKEVVERICASPKTSDFSSFTVLMQGQFILEKLIEIPPTAFRPQPQVMSQIVRGRRRPDPHTLSAPYKKFVKAAFLNKRKTLKNGLKSFISSEKTEALFAHFGFNAFTRPEEVETDLWPQIFKYLNER